MAGEEWWPAAEIRKSYVPHMIAESSHATYQRLEDGRYLVTKLKDKRTRIHIDAKNAQVHYDAINAAADRRRMMHASRLKQTGYGDW